MPNFGFWILDYKAETGNVITYPRPLIQNPKSKIQNPKSTDPGVSRPDKHLPVSIHLLVVAGFVLLTFLLTLPLGLRLSTHVVGGGDAWQNIWNLWWVKESLLNLYTNPYHTALIYYPYGADLYCLYVGSLFSRSSTRF